VNLQVVTLAESSKTDQPTVNDKPDLNSYLGAYCLGGKTFAIYQIPATDDSSGDIRELDMEKLNGMCKFWHVANC
jgi:hypothetical protein